MWGPHVSGLTVFGTGKPYGHISGAATYDAATGTWTVTGAATVDIVAETTAAVLMAQRIIINGGVLTVPAACKGHLLFASRRIQAINGGKIHIDGLGKAGDYGAITPYSLLPAAARRLVHRARLEQYVVHADGALGAARATSAEGTYVAGHTGMAAGAMQTGGGGSGAINDQPGDYSGAGGVGGPCCGGAASGGGHNASGGAISADAGSHGGPGTVGKGSTANYTASSGAGQPPGAGAAYCQAALLGGGGLLWMAAPDIDVDPGSICSSDGAQGGIMSSPGAYHFPGGSAGGGIVMAVTRPGGWHNNGTVRALGGAAVPGSLGIYNGGPGGPGSVNIFISTD